MIRKRRRELPRTAGWQSRERRRQLPRTAGSLSRERRQEVPRTAGWESRERRRKLPRTAGWESRERRHKTPANGGHQGSRRADSLAARDKTREQNNTLEKTNKTKRGEGTTLTVWSGLLSRCTQQGEMRNTQTRKYFKIIVFNDNIRVTQGKVDTPGITSRPDDIEYKKTGLKYTW